MKGQKGMDEYTEDDRYLILTTAATILSSLIILNPNEPSHSQNENAIRFAVELIKQVEGCKPEGEE